ncbi:MAG TPA: glycoside hydrolase family 16 protein [Pyrinomonadaceae bacterium]|nr:glycoside hydrolase family 16 protein [Pyrinomonadaceae bacterium]
MYCRTPFRIFPRPSSLLLTLTALLCLSTDIQGQTWRLAWHDEFNGAKGAGIDETKWSAEIGGSGWGNQELEYYTADKSNAYTDGQGHLIIKAIKETLPAEFKCWYGPCLYTSARIYTKRKFTQRHGRFEARIKLPFGQGMWPAFWMLGDDIDAVGWPACGEIDVMENIGREPDKVHGTIHGPEYSGTNGIGASYTLPHERRFADDFHIFAVEWETKEIRWYVDGKLYETRRSTDIPAGAKWVYDHPFFIILNLAIGGSWPGLPNETTTFPQTMMVDYVRVYER